MNFKRIMSILLVLSMVFALALMAGCSEPEKEKEEEEEVKDLGAEGRQDFIDGIGGVSETYKGAVSEEEYETADAAAEAFVAEEVVGNADAEILATESKGELSASKVEALNIPAEYTEGMQSVEEIVVEYQLADEETLYADGVEKLDTLNKSVKVTVYVIKYENSFKYFAPCPVTGETISQSYYNSVFNAEKYKNCTMEYVMDVNADVNIAGTKMTIVMKFKQLVKHADGKVYMEQTVESDIYGEKTKDVICAYMEEDADGKVVCYVKTGENATEWNETYLSQIGFSSLDELTPFYNQYLDYTYFTKTNYGFAVEGDNAEQYMGEVLEDAGIDDMLSGLGAGGDMDLSMYAEYYVSEGVLSGMRMDASISMDMKVEGYAMNMVENITSNVTCTNYGTTVVEKPFEE